MVVMFSEYQLSLAYQTKFLTCYKKGRGGGGQPFGQFVTTFHVTISWRGGGGRAILDNVTKSAVFFIEVVPKFFYVRFYLMDKMVCLCMHTQQWKIFSW